MKKMLATIAAVAVMGMASFASATIMTDTTLFTATGTDAVEDYVDHGRGDVNYLSAPNLWEGYDFVTWQHQFTFVPAAQQIQDATLTLSFRDDQYTFFGITYDDIWSEVAFGYTEGGIWELGEVNTGDYSYGVSLASVADGVFQVTVASMGGDFYLDKSVLTVDYTPVPEPGTFALLGAGLLGLGLYGRRKKQL